MLQLRVNLIADRDAQRITEEFMKEDPAKADRFRQDLIGTFKYILQYPGGFQFEATKSVSLHIGLRYSITLSFSSYTL